MKRAAVVAGGDLLVGFLGVGERWFGTDGNNGVELVVERAHARERRLKRFHGRDLARSYEPGEVGQALFENRCVGHDQAFFPTGCAWCEIHAVSLLTSSSSAATLWLSTISCAMASRS